MVAGSLSHLRWCGAMGGVVLQHPRQFLVSDGHFTWQTP